MVLRRQCSSSPSAIEQYAVHVHHVRKLVALYDDSICVFVEAPHSRRFTRCFGCSRAFESVHCSDITQCLDVVAGCNQLQHCFFWRDVRYVACRVQNGVIWLFVSGHLHGLNDVLNSLMRS